MDAPLLDAKINAYKQRVKKLDSLSQKLPTNELTQYETARRNFEHRLKVWQQTPGSDLTAFENNVAEGYDELESHIISSVR